MYFHDENFFIGTLGTIYKKLHLCLEGKRFYVGTGNIIYFHVLFTFFLCPIMFHKKTTPLCTFSLHSLPSSLLPSVISQYFSFSSSNLLFGRLVNEKLFSVLHRRGKIASGEGGKKRKRRNKNGNEWRGKKVFSIPSRVKR